MLVALEWAVRKREDRWTPERETSALLVEITHAHLLTFLKAHGAKSVGKPIHIPRPWEKNDTAKPVMRMSEFVRQVMGAESAK